MTPLAHRIVKEMTLPVKSRTFDDRCGLLKRLDDTHCFDCSEVFPLAKQMAWDMAQRGEWLEQTAFLPAPRTWIEWAEDGERVGLLLEQRGDHCFGRVATAGDFASGERPLLFCLGGGAGRNEIEGHRMAYLWRAIIAMLAMINSPRIIGRKQHMPHRGLERKLANSKALVGKFPLRAWTELTLSVSDIGHRANGKEQEAHYTGEKCLHFCRAHLRIRNGRLERVTAHWRGNPALGIKRTRYRLAA